MTQRTSKEHTIQSIRGALIKLASEMVRGTGMPSPFFEDHKWLKTTPRAERWRVIREAERADNQCKEWAMRLRDVYSKLSELENG